MKDENSRHGSRKSLSWNIKLNATLKHPMDHKESDRCVSFYMRVEKSIKSNRKEEKKK